VKFNRLVETLLHTNNDDLALALDPSVIDMYDLKRCNPSESYRREFSFFKQGPDFDYEINEKCILDWNDNSNSTTIEECFPMFNSPVGFCLLINNYFTRGTYKEMQKFRNIFYQLHFEVMMEKNLTAEEIKDKLLSLSKDKRLKDHSAFIFMIITHGDYKKRIFGFDGLPIQIDYLVNLMSNANCKALNKKPKIFFINACRSGLLQWLNQRLIFNDFYHYIQFLKITLRV
jgi:hypothetical protein